MAMIEVDGLSKTYRVAAKQPGMAGTLRHFVRRSSRDVVAVRDLSFAIAPGEMVGFLGANGAGKTTTLKMLCGLIHPSSGLVRVAGYEQLSGRVQPPHRRDGAAHQPLHG